MTQTERIYRHMKDFGGITAYEAVREYGVTRPSARIADLKSNGVSIDSDWISGKNKYGEPVSFKRNKLKEE